MGMESMIEAGGEEGAEQEEMNGFSVPSMIGR